MLPGPLHSDFDRLPCHRPIQPRSRGQRRDHCAAALGPPPILLHLAGVVFDLPEQIQAHAARIKERAVVTKTMPPANRTHITEGERAILGAWIDGGAKGP